MEGKNNMRYFLNSLRKFIFDWKRKSNSLPKSLSTTQTWYKKDINIKGKNLKKIENILLKEFNKEKLFLLFKIIGSAPSDAIIEYEQYLNSISDKQLECLKKATKMYYDDNSILKYMAWSTGDSVDSLNKRWRETAMKSKIFTKDRNGTPLNEEELEYIKKIELAKKLKNNE